MFLTQIINAQTTELILCEECARSRGLYDPQALCYAEQFFPEALRERVDRIVRELSDKAAGLPGTHSRTADLISRCPVCGFSLEDYRRTSRLGCPDCYSVFAREFAVNISAAADSPDKQATEPPLREQLERKLREAVAREDYESAARLRDELKAIQS